MGKHTKGPWTAIDDGEGTAFVIDEQDRAVAEILWNHTIGPKPGEEHYANGYLIAAAPELLEACRVALGILGTGTYAAAWVRADTAKKLRAAIAKAEGNDYECPACSGDCAAAWPPMGNCPKHQPEGAK